MSRFSFLAALCVAAALFVGSQTRDAEAGWRHRGFYGSYYGGWGGGYGYGWGGYGWGGYGGYGYSYPYYHGGSLYGWPHYGSRAFYRSYYPYYGVGYSYGLYSPVNYSAAFRPSSALRGSCRRARA